MGHINGLEPSHILFVRTKKLAARRKVVIHDIENLAVHTTDQAGKNDRVGAVVHVSERNCVRPAYVQEDPKHIYAYAANERFFARAVNTSGPHDDIRNPEVPAVFGYKL